MPFFSKALATALVTYKISVSVIQLGGLVWLPKCRLSTVTPNFEQEVVSDILSDFISNYSHVADLRSKR